MGRSHRQRGVMLAFATVLVVVLSSIAIQYTATLGLEYRISRNVRLHRETIDLAEAGVIAAQELLREDPSQDLDGPNDIWAQVVNMPPYEVLGGHVTFEEFVDEDRALNVNSLLFRDRKVWPSFDRLMRVLGLPGGLREEMRDWIDPDDLPGPGGAESGAYLSRSPGFPAKNRPMDHRSELLLLRSMRAAWYWGQEGVAAVKDEFSVRPVGEFAVNLNTADAFTLQSLSPNISPSLAAQIIAERTAKSFTGRQDLVSRVPAMEEVFRKAAPDDPFTELVKYRSRFFRIRVTAEKDDYKVSVEAVLDRPSAGTVEVLMRRFL